MKKKEKIRMLESENKALNEKCEKAFELINAIKRSLKYFGVDMNVVFPEPKMINVTTTDDLISGDYQEKYVPGITTDSPNIVFDFTEHDMKVLEKRP